MGLTSDFFVALLKPRTVKYQKFSLLLPSLGLAFVGTFHLKILLS